VAPNTIRDYLGLYVLNANLPGLPVPQTDLDTLRAEYSSPPDPRNPAGPRLDRFTTPPDQFRAAQRAVLSRTAALWGVPEADLAPRLNARYALEPTAGPVHALEQRAAGLEMRFHDPQQYPRYATPTGEAIGTSDDWGIWDQQLAAAAQRYGTHRRRWPHQVRVLDDAQKYGSSHRFMALVEGALHGSEEGLQDLVAWDLFNGSGRHATLAEWSEFQTGQRPKYRPVNGQPVAPQTALAWDAILALYRALPDGPDRRHYRAMAQRIHRLALPAWQRVLDPDRTLQQAFRAPADEADDE